MKKLSVIYLSILMLAPLSLGVVSCSKNTTNNNESNNNNNDGDNNKDDNSKDDDTPIKKEEVSLATFTKDVCTNLVSAPKSTDGVYLTSDDVNDEINGINLKYSTNVGLTGNKDYPNCLQIKKLTENNLTFTSTSKKITKVILTSLKNTSYDTTYASLTMSVNGNKEENSTTDENGISTIVATYTLESETTTLSFSNSSERAMYLKSIEVLGYNE